MGSLFHSEDSNGADAAPLASGSPLRGSSRHNPGTSKLHRLQSESRFCGDHGFPRRLEAHEQHRCSMLGCKSKRATVQCRGLGCERNYFCFTSTKDCFYAFHHASETEIAILSPPEPRRVHRKKAPPVAAPLPFVPFAVAAAFVQAVAAPVDNVVVPQALPIVAVLSIVSGVYRPPTSV